MRKSIATALKSLSKAQFSSAATKKSGGEVQRILLTGANGQLGTDLLPTLAKIYGSNNLLATDIQQPKITKFDWNFEVLNVLNADELEATIKKFKPDMIMHMAAILSANGEKNPALCYSVNCIGFKNVIDLATKYQTRLFCPSTIAAFGPTTPQNANGQVENTTIQKPTTMYGCTKVFNELLGNYYKLKFGLDYRSIRYPQVISNVQPGGGSGDCFIEVFHHSLESQKYTSYLKENQRMPLIYIDDLVEGTMQLLQADASKLSDVVYNIQGDSFSMKDLSDEIKKTIPNLKMDYIPDFRQKIVESWPSSLDDSVARKDWNWSPKYQKREMTDIMLMKVSQSLEQQKLKKLEELKKQEKEKAGKVISDDELLTPVI